jgi:short-subunit dehydrogenase
MSIFQPVTLVTGASSGIGAALAQVFAEHGHEVALVARREPQLSAVADAIAGGGSKRPHVIAIDLARSDSPARIAHELLARGLEPAIVVNNAGFGLYGPAAELDRARQLEMIDVNVRTLTDLSLRWAESVIRHKGGILNVASVAGFLPGPGMAVYYATKAYVLSFSQSLHRELKPRGVRVTALCPGPVRTEFQRRSGMSDKLPRPLRESAEKVAREGYEGFVRGRAVVVPGFANKFVTSMPRVLPRGLLAALVEATQRPRGQAKSGGWPRRRQDPK